MRYRLSRLYKQNGAGGFSRNPNNEKYYVDTCARDASTKPDWIKIIRELKRVHPRDIDIQKSQLLDAERAQPHGDRVVVKIGDASSGIKNEFRMSKSLGKIKGFVKFVCHFTCADDFRDFFQGTRTGVCNNKSHQASEQQMHVAIMPFFPLGSVAGFSWTKDNLAALHSMLMMACVAYANAFLIKGFVHNDFHAANILLKPTKQKEMYDGIPTHGMRPWICDYENSYIATITGDARRPFADFKYDLQKLFFLLPTLSPRVARTGVVKVAALVETQLPDAAALTSYFARDGPLHQAILLNIDVVDGSRKY